MQRFPLAFWNTIVCIALEQEFTNITPQRGGKRCSLFVAREAIVMLSASETSHGVD